MTPLLPRARVVKQIARYGGDILTHAAMQGTKNFPHHGQTSVFAHSVAVTYLCVALALRLRLHVNMRALVRAALLHDYFLYDWHAFDGGEHRLHGFSIPAGRLKTRGRILRSRPSRKTPSCATCSRSRSSRRAAARGGSSVWRTRFAPFANWPRRPICALPRP